MSDRKRIPKIGDDIYLPSSLHLSHAVDDMLGGLAKVTNVEVEGKLTWVSTEEMPGVRYEWRGLERDQEKLKEEFKDRRARHVPDYSPKFNDQIYERYFMRLRSCLEGAQRAVRYVIEELPGIDAPAHLKSKVENLFDGFDGYLNQVINEETVHLQAVLEDVLKARQPLLEARKISLYFHCQTIMDNFDEKIFRLNELKNGIEAAEKKEGLQVGLLPLLIICHGADIMAYLNKTAKIFKFFRDSIKSGTVKTDDRDIVEKRFMEEALSIALSAHRGQSDKAGVPYITHPLRIMHRMVSEEEMIVALLHDVVEDTEWTLQALRQKGFSDEIITAIDCLTKRQEEAYESYIERIKANPLARAVKIADLRDNMDISRLSDPTQKDLQRIEKYGAALRALTEKSGAID